MLQFAMKPRWGINYITHERFRLRQLEEHIDMRGSALSIGGYFTEMLDPSMNWDDVAEMVSSDQRRRATSLRPHRFCRPECGADLAS